MEQVLEFTRAAAPWVATGKRTQNKFVFLGTLVVVAAIVFHVVYQNWVTF